MGDRSSLRAAREKCEKMGVARVSKTILFCADAGTAGCASKKQMAQSWNHLKTRLKELKLNRKGGLLRLKTGCFGVCRGGPIVVIVPDGIWYGRCTPPVLDRILEEHLIGGRIVEEFVIAQSKFENRDLSEDLPGDSLEMSSQ